MKKRNDNPFDNGNSGRLLLITIILICVGVFVLINLDILSSDPQQIRAEAAQYRADGQLAKSEKRYRWLVEHTPKNGVDETTYKATLVAVLTQEGKYQEAIPICQSLIDEGAGGYDLFAFYAMSLAAVGRTDDAIHWYYRTLSLVPQLVDVRSNLAKLLVQSHRPYEALALLSSYDAQLIAKGVPAYFQAQRMAIESKLKNRAPVDAANTLHLVKLAGSFYVSVLSTTGQSSPFMIDTGATATVLSPALLAKLGYTISDEAKEVAMRVADGRTIFGRAFVLPSLQIDSIMLPNVPVIVCADECASLLGASVLSRFDMQTNENQGVETMTLQLRMHR